MDDETGLALLAEVFKDEQLITVNIAIRDLWYVDSLMALAYRHPDLSLHQKNWIMHLHDQFIIPILEAHPEVKALIDAGWDEKNDVAPDPAQRARINDAYKRMEKRYLRKTGRL